jgi:uncharacterized DUF497 family protein
MSHIAQHGITPEEAEQVVLGDPLDLGFNRSTEGEDRWSYIGDTANGDVLQVVITIRGERIRVVTAFEPTRQDKMLYLTFRARLQ